jgi:hypothetical protein
MPYHVYQPKTSKYAVQNQSSTDGTFKDPAVAAYIKGGGPVEAIKRSHNGYALPPGWAVAAHSGTLYRTGAKGPRSYFINEKGNTVSWSRPRDSRKDFDKYKLSKEHRALFGDHRPSLTCMYDDKALERLEKSAALVRKRELSIGKSVRKIGPLVYIARLIFDDKSHFFDTWRAYTKWSLEEKEKRRQSMALKIQGRIRIKQARKRAYEIKHAAKVEAKIKMTDIHGFIAEFLQKKCELEDVKWFNEWTNGQRQSGFPGVITMSAEERRLKNAQKAADARLLVPKKKKAFRGALRGMSTKKNNNLSMANLMEKYAKTEDQQLNKIPKSIKIFERDQTEWY